MKRILLFSRQKEPILKPTRLKPVINESFRLLRSTIPANINLKTELYDGRDSVLCDTSEIHEIILNLCMNSYHAIIDDEGSITIRLAKELPPPEMNLPDGIYICLSVKDTGIGIPESLIDKIFEPYVTTKDIGKGSGIGLSIVYGIVKNYNGNIQVISNATEGTIFRIYLPITSQSEINGKTDVYAKKHSGDEKILFIDDEMSIVKLGVRTLEKWGYKITGIQSSLEAFELFKSNPDDFDLIITDMAMPEMVGSELAKKVFEIRPNLPIIVCSGYSEKLDTLEARIKNVKAVVDKPILMEDLQAKIREVLDDNNQSGK